MEHEHNGENVADASRVSYHTCTLESEYYTSIGMFTPNDAPLNARIFPTLLKEYQSKDIKEVKGEGQTIKYVTKGKGNKLGKGTQASGIREVVVDTGVEHPGLNPRFQTFAAKIFKGLSTDSLYGQWQEQVHGLNEYYGGYICQFYGYCRDYENYQGYDEDLEDCETTPEMDSKARDDEGYELASKVGSFCLLMRKYDCSLRNVIDEENDKNHNNRKPFPPSVAVTMMVYIAMGMKIVHQENIIHRDLKAGNVFVFKDATTNMPWKAHIGDFDISNSVEGTGYWRAPEILEAIIKRKKDYEVKIPWTPIADFYSYGMTCYEILTGGKPLENVIKRSDYQSVFQGGLRPKLPEDLNPDVRNLIVRCWHQDPLQRPTFDAILLEFREILHEFPIFFEALYKIKHLPPLRNKPSTEECILALEHQFQELRSKYPIQFFVQKNEVDFVKMGFHFVKCIKRSVRKFGYKPYIEHPTLPWSLFYARTKWMNKMNRLSMELVHVLPYFEEKRVIITYLQNIFTALCEGEESGNLWTEEEGINASQREAKWEAWIENVKKRPPLVDRHEGCIQKSNHGHYEGNKDYPICSFCKEKKKVGHVQKVSFRLFDSKFDSHVG